MISNAPVGSTGRDLECAVLMDEDLIGFPPWVEHLVRLPIGVCEYRQALRVAAAQGAEYRRGAVRRERADVFRMVSHREENRLHVISRRRDGVIARAPRGDQDCRKKTSENERGHKDGTFFHLLPERVICIGTCSTQLVGKIRRATDLVKRMTRESGGGPFPFR